MPHSSKQPAPPGEHTHVAETDIGFERLVFFSDAVMAIAITLLALEIRLPAGEANLDNAALLNQLIDIWPKYFGYVISFMVIGLYWMGHNRLFRNLRRYDNRLAWLNLIFLMLVGFLPFSTAVTSEHGNAVGTIFYSVSVIVTGLAMTALWWYAVHQYSWQRQPYTPSQIRTGLYRQLIAPAVFLISIPIALWDTNVARLCWFAMGAGLLLMRGNDIPPQR